MRGWLIAAGAWTIPRPEGGTPMRHGPGLLRFEPAAPEDRTDRCCPARTNEEPRQRLRNVQPERGTGSGSARPLRNADEVLRDPICALGDCSSGLSVFRACERCYRPCAIVARGIAQPGRAPALGAGGRRFESCCPDHYLVAFSDSAGRGSFLTLVLVLFLFERPSHARRLRARWLAASRCA